MQPPPNYVSSPSSRAYINTIADLHKARKRYGRDDVGVGRRTRWVAQAGLSSRDSVFRLSAMDSPELWAGELLSDRLDRTARLGYTGCLRW